MKLLIETKNGKKGTKSFSSIAETKKWVSENFNKIKSFTKVHDIYGTKITEAYVETPAMAQKYATIFFNMNKEQGVKLNDFIDKYKLQFDSDEVKNAFKDTLTKAYQTSGEKSKAEMSPFEYKKSQEAEEKARLQKRAAQVGGAVVPTYGTLSDIKSKEAGKEQQARKELDAAKIAAFQRQRESKSFKGVKVMVESVKGKKGTKSFKSMDEAKKWVKENKKKIKEAKVMK